MNDGVHDLLKIKLYVGTNKTSSIYFMFKIQLRTSYEQKLAHRFCLPVSVTRYGFFSYNYDLQSLQSPLNNLFLILYSQNNIIPYRASTQ